MRTDGTLDNAIDDEQTIVFTHKSTWYVNIADYVERLVIANMTGSWIITDIYINKINFLSTLL